MAHAVAIPVASSFTVLSGDTKKFHIPKTISVSSSLTQKFAGLNIRCARIGGVEIPNHKRIEYSLQYIHGVGRHTARQILCNLGMENKVTKELGQEELTKLRDEVSNYVIEGDLRRFNNLNIKRLIEIQCYRGRRHQKGLPCRGQRTKNNCRTLKGRGVAVTKKKKAPGPK
uniref:30S ribosomal protein S13, chloroplastic n=1 Tax=Araucaria cunninghamii TaxID=56994 RepID=A0A0D6R1S0_ARACU